MIVPRAYLFAFILAVSPALSASQKTSQPQRAQEEAAALWSSGNREESIARLTKALADDPEDIALREQLARQQLVVHRYAAALETTQAAGQALQHITAEALFYLDRFEEALPLLDSSDPTQALARVTAFEVLGYSDEATAALDEMVDLAGVDLLGMSLARGRLHAAAGRHEDAAFAYQSVLDKQPNDPGALFGLGQAWVRTGRREQGLELLKTTPRTGPAARSVGLCSPRTRHGPHARPSSCARRRCSTRHGPAQDRSRELSSSHGHGHAGAVANDCTAPGPDA